MIRLDRRLLRNLEREILGWAFVNRYRILGFFIAFIGILSFKSLPYLNLYVTRELNIFLTVASFLVIFSVGIRKIILLAVFLLVLALGALLFGEVEAAELFGNYVYGFLFIGVADYILRAKLE